MEALHPVACSALPGAGLTVRQTGVEMRRADCDFAAPVPVGFTGVAGPVSCRVAGEPVQRQLDLVLEGERLHLAIDGAEAVVYRRC